MPTRGQGQNTFFKLALRFRLGLFDLKTLNGHAFSRNAMTLFTAHRAYMPETFLLTFPCIFDNNFHFVPWGGVVLLGSREPDTTFHPE